ncbi:sialoadhesin-like, partial [Astyanax mexicanus]
ISGSSPPVSLTVIPSRSQHFTTDSLSLICEEQSKSTGWRVRRYSLSESKVSECSSGWGSVTGSTCNISSLLTSHTGVYWCESESGGSSNPVNITVHCEDVILESPVHPVTEGDHLTLRCLLRNTKPSDLTADFYKDGLLLQNQTTGEMIIPTVSKSDEGLYHCKIPEKGKSPQSWISVREFCLVVSGGSGVEYPVGVSVGVSLTLLFLILLTLLWCYKNKKGKTQNTNQTQSDQNRRGSGAQDSQDGQTPPQADAVNFAMDATYSKIDLKAKKKPKDKQAAVDVPMNVTYSEIDQKAKKKPKDKQGAGAESLDVTYAEMDLKIKKKPKRNQVAGAESLDVTYAEMDMKIKKKPKRNKESSMDSDTHGFIHS